jgi:uncharacterized RDD family membrane protein YckC
MKRAARNLILLCCVCLLAPSGAHVAAAGSPVAPPKMVRDLLAHGTDETFWCADVVPVTGQEPGTRTLLRYRHAGDALWKSAGEFPVAATSLSNRGAELLVVLEGGDWKLVADTGVRSGNSLPGGAEVLALAGDEEQIWAVAAARKGMSLPAPAPASATTSATTRSIAQPATSPLAKPHELGLFLLSKGNWVEKAPLPPGLRRGEIEAISLAAIDRKLMLAIATRDRAVRVFVHSPRGWEGGEDIATLGDGGRLKLLDLHGRPGLWIGDATSPGSLYLGGDRWQGPAKLQPEPKLAAFDRTALAAALGQLRLLASDGKGRLAEQIYSTDGTRSGETTEGRTAAGPTDARLVQMLQLILVAIMFVWMMGTLRTQRPGLQEAVRRADELNLASVTRRGIGALIDALPIVIGASLAERASSAASSPLAGRLTYESPELAWLGAGIAIYLLHTTLLEVLMARSIGKFITGTRVAALDGTRPRALSLLIRNVLRLVDIILVFPPIFVFFSPLRQRVGDMAAGTIVVRDGTPIVDPIEPPEATPPGAT